MLLGDGCAIVRKTASWRTQDSSIVSVLVVAIATAAAMRCRDDLTIQAASLCALPHRRHRPAPVRLSLAPQAERHAGAEAAGVALVALHERANSGLGQHVDVSAQQTVEAVAFAQLMDRMVGDSRRSRVMAPTSFDPTFVWAARDGYVGFMLNFGAVNGPCTKRLIDWAYARRPHRRRRTMPGQCDRRRRGARRVGVGAGRRRRAPLGDWLGLCPRHEPGHRCSRTT